MTGLQRAACSMVLVSGLACDSDRPTGNSESFANLGIPAAQLTTAPLAAAADSTALVQGIARSLAIALRNPGVRAELHSASKRSRVREGKIQLQRFLQHRGAKWGGQVSRAAGLTETAWGASVRRMQDLEMYLPVAAHRKAWQGTEDVLVLGLVEDDRVIRKRGGALVAYDTRGEPVMLSLSAKPTRPVIALVPAETEFAADGESSDKSSRVQPLQECNPDNGSCGGGGGGGTAVQPGDSLILYQSVIYNAGDYEGWPRGDPELVIALKALNSPTGTYTSIISCVHQDAYSPWRYDQNNNTWTGRAYMGNRWNIQYYIGADREPMFYIWEDDNGEKCSFQPEVADSLEANVVFVGSVLSTGSGIAAIATTGSPYAWAFSIASAVMGLAAYNHLKSGDDYVGMATVPKSSDPMSNPKTIMNKFSPRTRGYLYFQFRPNS